MIVKKLVLGELETNCYLVIDKDKCLIIDPASDASIIKEACTNYKVEGILVTHHHFDHVLALSELEEYYNLKHNDHSNSFDYDVIKTPGHTGDSLTFYFKEDKIMFTGDFLFYHTIGRYDFEDSSIKDMMDSLNLISKYDDDITVYPGHGSSTTLGEEKPRFKNYF